MPLEQPELQDVEERLGRISPSLLEVFHSSYESLPTDLPEARLRLWLDEGFGLTTHSLRSWEAGADYFRAGVTVLGQLDDAGYRDWSLAGRNLAELAAAVAAAYYRASPDVLPRIAGSQARDWAALGERLYKATWKSISLVSQFFTLSPVLLDRLTLPELGRLARVLEGVSDRSADLAAACLEATPNVARLLDRSEWLAFIDFAAAVSDSSWPEASLYFERGPELVRNLDTGQRAKYLELSTRVARRIGRQAYSLFAEGALAFREVPPSYHGPLVDLAGGLVALSPEAAMSLLRSGPVLSERLRLNELIAWHATGLEILKQTVEGGEAYFRLESQKAEQEIQTLSVRVELAGVSELLRLYGKALTGANVAVQPISALEEKGIGWVRERGPSTEGTSVYLPDFIELYDTKADNFAIFKVYATHQTAHIEFGSFEFSFKRKGSVLRRRRHVVERERRKEGVVTKRKWLTDMERFFDLFPDRQMASDLFTVAEDLRIDSRVKDEYSGIRRANRRVQEAELVRRPDVRTLPLRQAFVENLIRASLDGEDTIRWPDMLMALMSSGTHALDNVRDVHSVVEDTAEATLLLYDIAASIPNLPPELLEQMGWQSIDESGEGEEEGASDGLDQLPNGEEMPYESPEQVDFRGDFKPELVQLLMRMRQGAELLEDDDLSPLTEEQIKELLEKSVEIDLDSDDFDMSELKQLLENLEKEAGAKLPDGDTDSDAGGEEEEPPEAAPAVKVYYYDEWDFRAADYKPRWCAVRERILDEGSDDFYEKTMRDNASLINETQRQFEMLKPETFRKIKRLEDGEDIDLDAALDFIVQKRAGHGDVQKIYWRRNKIERDVAVAFLLDMSASTDEEIEKHRPRRDSGADAASDPRRYYQTLAMSRSQNLLEPPKRIIDIEKQSIVLLTRALEVIHDRYGIYGFSGYGRENVEFFVIKDLNETFDDVIRRRIDQVMPIRSTRMGPAIRHTTYKLEQSDAKAKILFLVSDGRPQDHGYGRDRTEKEYAIHDTHKALVEAKHKGIVPFALTVDKEGHDYLGQMCGDMAYEVLSDIELLPSRLPTLYRRLTE